MHTTNGDTTQHKLRLTPQQASATLKSRSDGSPGLSTAQISPLHDGPYRIETYAGGSLFKLKGPPMPGRGGGRRAPITGFSRRARRAMQQKLAAVNEQRVAEHRFSLTLTYPPIFSEDPDVWKKHLDRFLKRLKREYDYQAVVWKLEPQKRFAPHFHLLVFAPEPICHQWVAGRGTRSSAAETLPIWKRGCSAPPSTLGEG